MRAPSLPSEAPSLPAAPPARPLAPVVAERQRCPGCDAPVVGRFCPECGQSHQDVRVRFGRWVRDYVDDTFHLDSRFFRSLWALVRRPGALTHAYVAGERSRWVRPFRLYLMASAVYYLCFGLFGTRNAPELTRTVTPDGRVLIHFGPHLGKEPGLQVESDARPAAKGLAAEVTVAPGPETDDALRQRLRRFEALPLERAQAVVLGGIVRHLPKAMFLLVPVFALLVKLLHRRRYYAEHFVFALHVHAFCFLLLALGMPLPPGVKGVMSLTSLTLIAVYLFLAQRRVYANSRVRTGLKTAALFALYGLVLLLTVGGIGVGAILTFEA